MDETWLIPYSDLLTLLLALFIVLFASSQIDQKKFDQISDSLNAAFSGGDGFFMQSIFPGREHDANKNKNDEYENPGSEQSAEEQFEQETADLQELQRQVDQYIADNGLSGQLQTGLNHDQLKIIISDKALFDSGSAEVRPEARKIAMTISELLEQFPGFEIVVSGHTDNQPIHNAEFANNWELSTQRALNFMQILLMNKALDPARFSAVGYGEYRPVASNDTPEGRALNRRVEVSVLRNFTLPENGENGGSGTAPAAEQQPGE